MSVIIVMVDTKLTEIGIEFEFVVQQQTSRAHYPYKLGTSLKQQQQQQQDAKLFQRRPSSLINSKNTLALTSTKLGLCIPQFYNKSVLI